MPGLPSPDLPVTPTPEQSIPQKVEPKPIGERIKGLLERIKAKTKRETPNPDPDAGLAEIAAVPDLEPSDANSADDLLLVETPEKPAILDPEAEYQKALEQVQLEAGKDPFAVLKKHAPQEKPSPATPEQTRVFTFQDKARHTLLALEARRQGIKDIVEFNRLVEYFETTLTDTKFNNTTYRANISADERVKIVAAWRAKGYKNAYFDDSDKKKGKLRLTMYKDTPYNITLDNIPVIKKLLETGVDPIPLIEALRLHEEFHPHLLRSYHLKGPYSPTGGTKFIELLQDPNLATILPIIEGVSSVPHNKLELHRYGDEKTQVDELRELAREGDLSAYSTEFFEKAGVLARILGRNINVGELPVYNELIHNPDKLAFLAAVIENGGIPGLEQGFSHLDSLNALEKDNLLNPLTVLLNAGIKIGPIFGGHMTTYNSPVLTQNEVSQRLLQFVGEPSVQSILQDQDRQTFARILRKMNGSSVPASLADELYPVRQDLVALNNFIFSSLDAKHQPSYPNDSKLEELKSLALNEERKKVLLSPEFQEFIAGLQKDKGITLEPRDFFRYEHDIFDHREYSQQRLEPLLIQLFKARDIIDIIDPDMQKRIINPPTYNIMYDDLHRLGRFTFYSDTLKLLKQSGVPLDPEKFRDTDWVATVSRMPLIGSSFLNEIPQDRKTAWINASLKLPHDLQESIGGSIQYDINRRPIVTNEDINRVCKLGDIISSSDFFPKEHFISDAKMQVVYGVLGEYKGDIDNLFTEGKPNVELAKLLIDLKNPSALSIVLRPDMLESFEGDSRNALGVWIELPYELQIRFAADEIAFPDVQPDVADRYRVMADLMRFANIESMDSNLINLVRWADNYQELLIDGRPSRTFIDAVIKKNPQNLPKFLTENTLSQYDDTERSVLTTWMVLPDDLKQEVIREAPDFPNIPADQAEKYRVAAEVITRIRNSPSAEIKRIERELIGQLWKLDNPTQALEEIIGVFEKNNLPLVGKVYRVFETIYDNPNTVGGTTLERDLSTRTNLSPVLRTATPKERREIIYKDLLSINVASGNPQLRNYLEVVRDGEAVVAKMEQEGVAVLSERERQQLGHFFDKMDMLYSSSLFGRTIESRRRARQIDSSPTTSHLSLEERSDALRRNFRVRADQKLTDRLSEMFLRPLGLTSIEEVLTAMDRSKAEADMRNRQFAESNEGKIVLKAGDRFKGVDSSNIGKILERGAVAREYLGVSAGSDATPYDSDTSLILEGDLTDGVASATNASMSTGYGNLLLLLKDRGQFGTEQNQYESFSSGGGRHFGIRTGFASTEIDALVLPNALDSRGLDDLFIAIAQNGVYMPVSNSNGGVVFTPEKFDEYRRAFDGVSEYSANPVSVTRVDADQPIRKALDQLVGDITTDRAKVIELSSQIRQRLKDALALQGVALRGEFDTSIYGAELIDTGSTARGSNVPGDYDFDMSLQLDPNDSKRLGEIADIVKNTLRLQQDASHSETDYIQVRGMGSQIIEGETLDVDIGVGKRSDEGIFASSDAIAQKLDSIRATLGDGAYHDVLANIVLAKKILKEGHAYKKLEDGGMGGIGVENWILLHNGNVLDAFTSFWQAAHDESGNVVPYEEFADRYKVFDAGLNIKFNRHDNFVRILKPNGYIAMVNTIGQYLGTP